MPATISRKSFLTGGLEADSRFLPGNFPTAGVAAVARKVIAGRRRKYPYPVEDTSAHAAMPALKKSIGTAQPATWDMGAAFHLLKQTLSAPTWQEVRDASAITLHQAYPNPFNPGTTLRFSLSQREEAQLKIYNLGGREIISLAEGRFSSCEHAFRWDGRDGAGRRVASGKYIARLATPRATKSIKMVLLK